MRNTGLNAWPCYNKFFRYLAWQGIHSDCSGEYSLLSRLGCYTEYQRWLRLTWQLSSQSSGRRNCVSIFYVTELRRKWLVIIGNKFFLCYIPFLTQQDKIKVFVNYSYYTLCLVQKKTFLSWFHHKLSFGNLWQSYRVSDVMTSAMCWTINIELTERKLLTGSWLWPGESISLYHYLLPMSRRPKYAQQVIRLSNCVKLQSVTGGVLYFRPAESSQACSGLHHIGLSAHELRNAPQAAGGLDSAINYRPAGSGASPKISKAICNANKKSQIIFEWWEIHEKFQ